MAASSTPSVRRVLKELAELNAQFLKDSESPDGATYFVEAVNDNIFELHFTIRGPADSPYELGAYHGKILLPAEYPLKPPEISFLTPSGRFEVRKKICLSISDYHPESWQPAWGLRTVLIGITGFMAAESAGSIGSLVLSDDDRRQIAKESIEWKCPECLKSNLEILPKSGHKRCHQEIENPIFFAYSKSDSANLEKSPTIEQNSRIRKSRIDLVIFVLVFAIAVKIFL